MLAEAAAQVAPVVSEARTLDRFIAPVQERLVGAGAQPVVELGPRFRQPVPRSGSGALAAAAITIRSRCWARFRLPEAGAARRRNWCCTAASTTPTAACRNICRPTAPGARRHAGVLRPRPVAYFSAEFGLHESIADLFRRPGRSGGRSHQERVGSGHSAGRHRLVLRTGIFPPAPRCATAGSRKNISRPT